MNLKLKNESEHWGFTPEPPIIVISYTGEVLLILSFAIVPLRILMPVSSALKIFLILRSATPLSVSEWLHGLPSPSDQTLDFS